MREKRLPGGTVGPEDLPLLRADLEDHERSERQFLWTVRAWIALLVVLLTMTLVLGSWVGLAFGGFFWTVAAVGIFPRYAEASARTARLRLEIEEVEGVAERRESPLLDEPGQ